MGLSRLVEGRVYPVSSATISVWRGRTFPRRSSSSSAVFPTRQPPVPTSSRPDGLRDSTVPRVDLSGQRRCRGDFVDTIDAHWDDVLRWFQTRITNGVLEAINSLVQAAKRRARGYRTDKPYIAKI